MGLLSAVIVAVAVTVTVAVIVASKTTGLGCDFVVKEGEGVIATSGFSRAVSPRDPGTIPMAQRPRARTCNFGSMTMVMKVHERIALRKMRKALFISTRCTKICLFYTIYNSMGLKILHKESHHAFAIVRTVCKRNAPFTK